MKTKSKSTFAANWARFLQRRTKHSAQLSDKKAHAWRSWRIPRWLGRALVFISLGLLLALGLPNLLVENFALPRLYSPQAAPHSRVAIVFGAGLTRSGTPSAVLRDRVETAAQLYQAGKVDKILMSGDNRFINYNEPGAMRDYAIQLGVAPKDIVLDYAGRRTYDTCYRARFIFGVREAVVITQNFHIPRALYTCNALGVQSIGVPSEIRKYGRRLNAYWNLREVPATAIAVWEVWVTRPLPVLGIPEPIFIDTEIKTSLPKPGLP